jgi:hypothetical protein
MFDFVSPFDALASSSVAPIRKPVQPDPKRKSVDNLLEQLGNSKAPVPPRRLLTPYLRLISIVPKKRHLPLSQSSLRLHRVHFPPNPHKPLRRVVPRPRSLPPFVGMFRHRIPSRVASRLCSFACAYGPSSARKRKFARSAWELEGTRRWSQPWLRFQGKDPARSQVSALIKRSVRGLI